MSLRIAINGFGRIGRNILRAQHEQSRPDIDIAMIEAHIGGGEGPARTERKFRP